jgi:hypothetical protein
MHEDCVLVRVDVWVRGGDVDRVKRRLTEVVATLPLESARVRLVEEDEDEGDSHS